MIPGPAPVIELDVTDPAQLDSLADRVREHVDGLGCDVGESEAVPEVDAEADDDCDADVEPEPSRDGDTDGVPAFEGETDADAARDAETDGDAREALNDGDAARDALNDADAVTVGDRETQEHIISGKEPVHW